MIDMSSQWKGIAASWPEAQSLLVLGMAYSSPEGEPVRVTVDDLLQAIEDPSVSDLAAGMMGRMLMQRLFDDGFTVSGPAGLACRNYDDCARIWAASS